MKKLDFRKLVSKTFYIVQVTFIVSANAVIASWLIPPIRKWLEARNLVDQSVLIGVVSISLALIFSMLIRLSASYDALLNLIKKSPYRPESSRVIMNGVLEVYPYLRQAIDNCLYEGRKSITVLGLNLYTAWPFIRAWIELETTSNWDVTLFCLDSNFIKQNEQWFSDNWATNSESMCGQINRYIQSNRVLLLKKGINLELIKYRILPSFHGFRLSNGHIFISFTHWADQSNVLNEPHQPYEEHDSKDNSFRAEFHRKLFDNWAKRARNTNADGQKETLC